MKADKPPNAIVVDTSVVAKWFLPELLSAEADAVLEQVRLGRLQLSSPDLIILIRRGGTPMLSASRFWLSLIGLRNSSSKTSPGCTGLSFSLQPFPISSMVVNNFRIVSVAIVPDEANTPLIIDANTILATPATAQLLKAICRRNPQIVQARSIVQHSQLS